MAEPRGSWLNRFKKRVRIAMHAYPALHCRSRSLAPGTPAAALFDDYRHEIAAMLAAMPVWQRWAMVCFWPPGVILTALFMTAVNGAGVSRRYGRGVISQLTGQIRLAFDDGMLPLYYYAWELHEPGNRQRAHEYIQRGFLKNRGLYTRLYRTCPQRERQAKGLNSKRAIDRFCREFGLPTARLFACVEDGQFSWTEPWRTALPETSLFVKMSKSKGGSGAERWLYRDGAFHGHRGRRLDAAALTAHLARLSRRQPLLVQQRLVNHPDLDDLTAGALSTLRMYTFWSERGAVEHIASTFRTTADPGDILDIEGQGALAASVDPAAGAFGRATDPSVFAKAGWFDHHPLTGAEITGRRIPYWREAVELVCTAHRHLGGAFLIGWDIGVTRDGPVIVEGNKSPDIELEQRLYGPWANQRFGQLLLHHLQAEAAGASPLPRPAARQPELTARAG